MPKVSIIMGIYNCKSKEILYESFQSIVDQTYTDWEMIVCDDGSSNDSLKWAQDFEDPRIKVISYEENRGLEYSLNECLKIAKGELIARQDDDDLSCPNRLAEQVRFLEEHPEYDIVGSLAEKFDDTGELGIYNVPEYPAPLDFRWNCPILHPTVVMRAESLRRVSGYRVAPDIPRCEDYDLFMRMYSAGMRAYNIQKPLYRYRLVNGGYKKRPLKVRIGEMRVRYRGFKQLGILKSSIPYVIKPIILWLIPLKTLNRLRNKRQ